MDQIVTLDCAVFDNNEIYLPIRLISKLSSDYGLLRKMKSNLEDLYLNIKKCILSVMKKYTT